MGATYSITCGNCGEGISADVVSGLENGGGFAYGKPGRNTTLWLSCPSCKEGSVKLASGAVYPTAPAGGSVAHLPPDVELAWREARTAHAVAAYTASEIMCRKILMHVAVDVAGSAPGKKFIEYVDHLEAAGYITAGLKPTVDKIRQRGNSANHELPASTEEDSKRTLSITEYLLRGAYELANL